MTFEDAFARCPLVAILRGVRPEEVVGIGEAIVAAGFTLLEVPLNSPEPFDSIRRLSDAMGPRALVGSGTVLAPQDVDRTAAAGGRIVVSPTMDPGVIGRTKALGLHSLPGFLTPTEAFAALAAGADALKLFPAEMAPPQVVRALRAVLPRTARLMVVGGVSPDTIPPYLAAGVDGFGVGSDLYRPGRAAEEVGRRAAALVATLEGARRAAA